MVEVSKSVSMLHVLHYVTTYVIEDDTHRWLLIESRFIFVHACGRRIPRVVRVAR